MKLTSRAFDRLDRDFGDRRQRALDVIEMVNIGPEETEGDERILAAMLIWAAGNIDRLLDAAALAEVDWRDLLVNAELADEDWRDGVNAYFVPPVPGE